MAKSKYAEDTVLVEVYIKGKGPVHKLKVPWQGWDKKQIDLEDLTNKCRLRAVYAYSLTGGRGMEQFYNPKTGLSLISYSGKPDTIIRFDGEPKPTVSSKLSRYALSAVLMGLLMLGTTTSQNKWVQNIKQAIGGRSVLLACIVIVVFSHLSRRSFKIPGISS